MKMLRSALFSALLCCFSLLSFSQWKTVYHGTDSTNEITGISFYASTEGYIASTAYIGYTQDGGRTFQKKFITYSNVDFNGYGVNLTFGFEPAGIKAFSKDKLLVYGDYGFEPAILSSADGGTTWKVVYHKNIDLNSSSLANAVYEMKFYSSTAGYAVQRDEVIKTTDGGQTWVPAIRGLDLGFSDLSLPDATTGYAITGTRIFKLNLTWGIWSELSNVPQGATKVSFVTASTGFLHCRGYNGSLYYKTTNGGQNWTLCGTADLPAPFAEDMEFVNETTGFVAAEGYQIFKTSDSGKTWELCKGSNDFTYLGYGFSRLFFLNAQTGWAGGYHDLLSQTTTGGEPTLPKAQFKINKSTFCQDGTVQLENYSRSGYAYQWLLNGSPIATTYNASYKADASPYDTIQLVVSNGVDRDTAVQVTEAQAFGAFTFVSQPESDTACSSQSLNILIPNSDPNTNYGVTRGSGYEATANGNGGLLKLRITYYGSTGPVRYQVDAVRTTSCGVERKSNTHEIYFFSPYIDVTAQSDTVCSGITQYVKVLNSLPGYEYWIENTWMDSVAHMMGNGGTILLPLKIKVPKLGIHDPRDPYLRLRVKIYAKHAVWGCQNIFPRTEVDMVVRDPWARFNVVDYEIKTGQSITVKNGTWDGDSYVWKAEGTGVNNNSSTAFEPADLSFSQPGAYKLALYATSKQGCSDTASTTLQVYDAATITRQQMAVCATDTLQSDYFYKALDSYKDAGGNLYITGSKMKLNSYFGTKGLEGWFLIKKDRTGKTVWEKSNTIPVGEGHIITESVVADAYENVYLYGHLYRDRMGAPPYFVDTVYFGGGTSIAFVAKLNKAGRLLWMRQATNSTVDDTRRYPMYWRRPFTAGSLVMGKNNDLFLKIASDYAIYEFGETPIRSGRDETFLFHLDQDGKLLDHQRFPSRDGVNDMWATNWDHYHHTPKMQWNAAGNLVFTALLDSNKTISSISGIPLSFDTRKVNTALFVYDTTSKAFTSILPIYQSKGGQPSATLPLAFATDDAGSYYTAAYNRVIDTLQPGPNSLVFPVDLSAKTDPSYKLKTVLAKFDSNGNQVWQKLVDGLKPTNMFWLKGQLLIGGENYAVDYYKLGGHSYNSDIGKPYYYATKDTLFIGYPSAERKKISYLSNADGSNGQGIEGAGGIDLLFVQMDGNGSNVQLKTFGDASDERLFSMAKDSCGNVWGIGYSGLQPTVTDYSYHHYSQSTATMAIWNWNYDNECRTGVCSSLKPSLRFDPVVKGEKCVDTVARLVWSSSLVDNVNISYRKNDGTYAYLVQNYPADSLKLEYNPKAANLLGAVHFKIEATDGTAMDTLNVFLASNPPKKFFAKDTVACYYDRFTLRSIEGPYRYEWRGGNWNHDIQTIVPPGSSGQVGVTLTDTLTGCATYDYVNVIRKPWFPQANIVAASSSNERIVSTECSIRHEWRLNGVLLPDTGCVLIPKDTGTYSVATVMNGCVSSIYGGDWGYYRVTAIPRSVVWVKPPSAQVQCVDSVYTVQWTASAVVEKVKIRVRRANETTFTTLAAGLDAAAKQYRINLQRNNLEGAFELLLEEDADATINDTITVKAGTKPVVNLGADITVCAGSPVTLNGPQGSGLAYAWSTGATTAQLSFPANGNQTVVLSVTTAAGCESRDSIQVTGFALPQPVILKDTGSVLRTYYCSKMHRWYLDGNLLAGETSCELRAKKGGVYTVLLEENNCQSEMSEPFLLTATANEAVVIGPNPATDKITVSIKVPADNTPLEIEIVGDNGSRYFLKDYGRQNKGTFTTDINLSFIQSGGLYVVRTTIGNEVFTSKIIVIR